MNNYNKIVNPETGRKVKVSSKIGQRVIKNYLNVQNGGSDWYDVA